MIPKCVWWWWLIPSAEAWEREGSKTAVYWEMIPSNINRETETTELTSSTSPVKFQVTTIMIGREVTSKLSVCFTENIWNIEEISTSSKHILFRLLLNIQTLPFKSFDFLGSIFKIQTKFNFTSSYIYIHNITLNLSNYGKEKTSRIFYWRVEFLEVVPRTFCSQDSTLGILRNKSVIPISW